MLFLSLCLKISTKEWEKNCTARTVLKGKKTKKNLDVFALVANNKRPVRFHP